MADAGLRVERTGAMLRLCLDREAQRNAIDNATAGLLEAAARQAAEDPRVRVVVLTGAGRAFCSGGDFAGGPDAWRQTLEEGHFRAVHAILRCPKPWVARVNGLALGAGLDLALACDLRVAVEDAPLGAVFAWAGSADGTLLLPRLVGLAVAQELLLLGQRFTGRRGLELGLMHRAVPATQLDTTVDEIVQRLAEGPTTVLGLVKAALRDSVGRPWEAAATIETDAARAALDTEDCAEAYRALALERRRPRFSGR